MSSNWLTANWRTIERIDGDGNLKLPHGLRARGRVQRAGSIRISITVTR